MKKLILTAAAVFAFGFANAQDKTKKGDLLVEVNTGFGKGVGNTSLSFNSGDGGTDYNIGAEGGYFIIDNLALKLGLGYGGNSPKGGTATSGLGYKVGAKYYVSGMIPVEVSYNGGTSSVSGAKVPSYVGLQAGYAIFLGDMVSLEPGIRYNNSLDTDLAKSDIQFNMGFALHF